METKNKSFFQNPLVIIFGALLCCALWGSATPFIKMGSAAMIPVSGVPSTILFAGMRFTAAGIITLAIYSISRRKILIPKLRNVPKILTVSAFQTVIQYLFFYVGLTYTSGVKGTILSGSSAFFCVLIASLVFRQEKLSTRKLLACALGIAGIVIINLNGLELTFNFTGDGFVILSTISLAFSSIFMKRFSKYEEPVLISGYQFIIGGAFMVLIGILFGGSITIPDLRAAAIFIYLAALSAVAYAVWGLLLKHNPVSRVTIFSFSTPIFGTLLSMLMLDEASNTGVINLIITLILVSFGIFLLNYSRTPKAKPGISSEANAPAERKNKD